VLCGLVLGGWAGCEKARIHGQAKTNSEICCGDAELAMAAHISDPPKGSDKTQQTQQVALAMAWDQQMPQDD
jgi:hypothetical protein